MKEVQRYFAVKLITEAGNQITYSPKGPLFVLAECYDALAAERDAMVTDLLALLPGTHYMDPPDGGDVPVLVQLQRMAEDARKWRDSHCDHEFISVSVIGVEEDRVYCIRCGVDQ